MNPIMRSMALWFSETFIASTLEVIFQTIIEVWNYSVLKYDLPLSCITINETEDDSQSKTSSSGALEELVKITNNLIDFTQDEIVVHSLPHIGEPNAKDILEYSDILTPLKGLASTLNNEFEVTDESSMKIQNADDINRIVTANDGTGQAEGQYNIEDNGEYKDANDHKTDIKLANGDGLGHSNHSESPDLLKEYKKTNAKDTIIKSKANESEVSKNGTSVVDKITHSELLDIYSATTQKTSHENDGELISKCNPNIISKHMEGQTLDYSDCWSVDGSECSLEYEKESTQNKGTKTKSNDSKKKSLREKQRRVQFSKELNIFVYEPEKDLNHPCVILKSQVTDAGNMDNKTIYRSALITEDRKKINCHSSAVKEKEKEIVRMFQENKGNLPKLRKVYDEIREDSDCFSDESDLSDVSLESQRRIEEWVQLTTDENKLLLENTYPMSNCSSQQKNKERDSKAFKTEHRNIRLNKSAVTAARKQSKDILDKICKKLFIQKAPLRK